MARIKTTAIVDSISGKIAGTVFSRNRYGAYAKGKGVPRFKHGTETSESVSFPQSGNSQDAVRARLSAVSKGWRELPAPNIASWNAVTQDYGKTDVFGDVRYPTGFNIFVGINSKAQAMGALRVLGTSVIPEIKLPPTRFKAPFVVQATLAVTGEGLGASEFNIIAKTNKGALEVVSEVNAILVEVTRPLSAGVSSVGDSEFRQIAVFDSAVNTAGEFSLNILSQYEAKFGSLGASVGKRVFVKISFVNILTGQSGRANQFSEKVFASTI